MASSSPFMDDYSSENYSSSDDDLDVADDFLLIPATTEDQPIIDDHADQPEDGAAERIDDHENQPQIPEAEAVEDSVEEREMSGVKETVVVNDVEVDSEHEADNLATVGVEGAQIEPEVLMELTEADIEKYAGIDDVLARELATIVEKDEAVIDEPSHEIDVPEPTVEESEAMIDEPSDAIVVPEGQAMINEPSLETYRFEEEHGIEGGSEEPGDGFSAPELVEEVSDRFYDPSYQSDSSIEDFYSTDGIEEEFYHGIDGVDSTWTTIREPGAAMIDEPSDQIEEREAKIDEPSYEMVAPHSVVVEGEAVVDEPSDEIDGSTYDSVLERFGRVISLQDAYSSDDDEFSSDGDSDDDEFSSDDDEFSSEDDDEFSSEDDDEFSSEDGDEFSSDDDEFSSDDDEFSSDGDSDGDEFSSDGDSDGDEFSSDDDEFSDDYLSELERMAQEEYSTDDDEIDNSIDDYLAELERMAQEEYSPGDDEIDSSIVDFFPERFGDGIEVEYSPHIDIDINIDIDMDSFFFDYSSDDDEIYSSIDRDLLAELERYADGSDLEELSPDGDLPSDEIDGFEEDYYIAEMASFEDGVEEEYSSFDNVLFHEMDSFMENYNSELRRDTFANGFSEDYLYPSGTGGHTMGPWFWGDYLYPSGPGGHTMGPWFWGDYLYPSGGHIAGPWHSGGYSYPPEDYFYSGDYLDYSEGGMMGDWYSRSV